MTQSEAENSALHLVKRRRFCAHWLLDKAVLKSLLKKRLIVPCGFYSVCLADTPRWTLVSYANPETAFDDQEPQP